MSDWTEEDQKALEDMEINYSFSCHVDGILRDNGFNTLGEVAKCTRGEILLIGGIGESKAQEIEDYLISQGLQLKE